MVIHFFRKERLSKFGEHGFLEIIFKMFSVLKNSKVLRY